MPRPPRAASIRFPRPRRLVLLAALTVSAGCSVGPDYERPATPPAPATWREVDAGQAAVAPDWWHSFGSDELDRMITKAASDNYDIKAAMARIRQAEAQVEVSASPLFPTISGSGSGTRTKSATSSTGNKNGQTGFASSGINPISNNFSTKLQATYQLDFWGANRDALASSKALLDYSRFDRQTVLLSTLSSVASDYFQVLALRDRLALAHQSLDSAKEVLRGIQAQARAGTATEVDIANQVTVVEQENALIPTLEQTLAQQVDALAILLGVLPENLHIEGTSLAGLKEPVVTAGLPSTLLERRPDVASAEANLISANALLKQAIANEYPTISMTVSGGYQSSMIDTLINPQSRLWSLGTSISQTFFDGGKLFGLSAQQRGKVEEMAADYQKAVVSAFSNVEDALVAVRRTREARDAQAAVTAAAERALKGTLAQFQRGTVTTINVLDAQRTLFSAQDTLAQDRLAYMQSMVTLYQALGGGWTVKTENPTEADAAPPATDERS